jgi:hypothetical protein
MKSYLSAAWAALLASVMSASPASACILGIFFCGGNNPGGGTSVPEFDGPGGVAAVTLLVSLGLLLYNRARK